MRTSPEAEPGWVLVVGGSGGLGAACAKALVARGRRICVTYNRNPARAEALAADLGERVSVRQLTLPDGDPGELEGLTGIVFAAGADIGQPYISELMPGDLTAAVDLELHGLFKLVRAALPQLRSAGGSIVALTSAGLGRFPPGDALSVVPKAAVQALIRGLAREEGRYGIRANAVAVGVADGGLFHRIDFDERWKETAKQNIALRRFGRPEEIASVVCFLLGSDASYVTGQTLYADGGYAI